MEKIKNYNINTFIERINNGHYTALYNNNNFVGGITLNNKDCVNGGDISIRIFEYNAYITINNNHNIVTIIFDSFEN